MIKSSFVSDENLAHRGKRHSRPTLFRFVIHNISKGVGCSVVKNSSEAKLRQVIFQKLVNCRLLAFQNLRRSELSESESSTRDSAFHRGEISVLHIFCQIRRCSAACSDFYSSVSGKSFIVVFGIEGPDVSALGRELLVKSRLHKASRRENPVETNVPLRRECPLTRIAR